LDEKPAFTHLSFSVAFALFIFAEYIRYFAIYPFGVAVHLFMNEFLDDRDGGTAILSHFYLLTGCAGSLWLEGCVSNSPSSCHQEQLKYVTGLPIYYSSRAYSPWASVTHWCVYPVWAICCQIKYSAIGVRGRQASGSPSVVAHDDEDSRRFAGIY